MIKENTESPSDEQTKITSSVMPHMNEQLTPITNSNQWKQSSFQGLERPSKELSTPKFTSTTQRVKRFLLFLHSQTNFSFFHSLLFSLFVEQQLFSIQIQCIHPLELSKRENQTIHRSMIRIHQVNLINLVLHHSIDLSFYPEALSISKRSQSIQSRTPFIYGLTSNDKTHHCPPPPPPPPPSSSSTSKTSLQSSGHILRHISSPSLDIFRPYSSNTMSLSRSSFGRNHVRKKQPRTNPHYVNIQIQTNDGSFRSTYIRLDDLSKCQTLTLSSTSSTSSSEQDSILDCSHSYSNGYFPSDETISTDRTSNVLTNQPNHLQTLPRKTRTIIYNDGEEMNEQ